MNNDQHICQLNPELYEKIENWRNLFANSHGIPVPEMNIFVMILLERSEIDLHILLWDYQEADHVIKKFGLRNLN
jgi:hypothetical protein